MGMPSISLADVPHVAVETPEIPRDGPDQRTPVLIIEDHPMYVDGLRMNLEGRGHYNVVGVAETANAALSMARQYDPRIILLDVELPGVSGFDLISPLSRICPEAKIVILTGHGEDEYALIAVRLGAHGYLQKDITPSMLVNALDQVVKGERVIGKPKALTAVLAECTNLMRERDREKLGVTDQEIQIMRLAASGMNNRDIGEHQFFSEITVKRKMKDIYRKLGVKTRAQAVAEAIRLGYI